MAFCTSGPVAGRPLPQTFVSSETAALLSRGMTLLCHVWDCGKVGSGIGHFTTPEVYGSMDSVVRPPPPSVSGTFASSQTQALSPSNARCHIPPSLSPWQRLSCSLCLGL